MCSIFQICSPTDRPDPNGHGWYVNRDGNAYTPDQIDFDERMPNLLPKPSDSGFSQLFDQTLSWAQRVQNDFVDPCPSAAQFHPGVARVTGMIGGLRRVRECSEIAFQ